MALIDEYKQAIKDVLDGRAKEAPRPSELPWTEDKLAATWAAVAAELIAEDNAGGGGGGGLLVTLTYPEENEYVCDKTAKEMWDVTYNGGAVVFKHTYSDGVSLLTLMQAEKTSSGHYGFTTPTGEYFEADSDSDYPTYFLT